MKCRKKGVQAVARESCPQVVYVDCSARVLNLVLVKFHAVSEVESTFDFKIHTVVKASNFKKLKIILISKTS